MAAGQPQGLGRPNSAEVTVEVTVRFGKDTVVQVAIYIYISWTIFCQLREANLSSWNYILNLGF